VFQVIVISSIDLLDPHNSHLWVVGSAIRTPESAFSSPIVFFRIRKLPYRTGAQVKRDDSSAGDDASRFLTTLCSAVLLSAQSQVPTSKLHSPSCADCTDIRSMRLFGLDETARLRWDARRSPLLVPLIARLRGRPASNPIFAHTRGTKMWLPSQMPDFGGSSPVIVVASIVVGNRSGHQLVHIQVIQARDADAIELSAKIRRLSPCE
jgi:hypothetical protein